MENELAKIQSKIYEIRGQKVMLDRDLAELYGVELKRLNEATKRNQGRFPLDFMFQLTQDEWGYLRSQFATANKNIAKIRFFPYVFTEQGVAMLSSILNSDHAIKINVNIMRAFVKLRHCAFSETTSSTQLAELRKLLMLHIENTGNKLSEHDEQIKQIVLALNNLMEKPKETKQIGSRSDNR